VPRRLCVVEVRTDGSFDCTVTRAVQAARRGFQADLRWKAAAAGRTLVCSRTLARPSATRQHSGRRRCRLITTWRRGCTLHHALTKPAAPESRSFRRIKLTHLDAPNGAPRDHGHSVALPLVKQTFCCAINLALTSRFTSTGRCCSSRGHRSTEPPRPLGLPAGPLAGVLDVLAGDGHQKSTSSCSLTNIVQTDRFPGRPRPHSNATSCLASEVIRSCRLAGGRRHKRIVISTRRRARRNRIDALRRTHVAESWSVAARPRADDANGGEGTLKRLSSCGCPISTVAQQGTHGGLRLRILRVWDTLRTGPARFA